MPFISLLILSVLPRMSDFDESVRTLASLTFSSMVKLVPLDNNTDDDVVDLPPALNTQRLQSMSADWCID